VVKPEFPDTAALAALRAWYEGVPARDAVKRYLPEKKASGQSSRAMIGRTRKQLGQYARRHHRLDLAALFEHSSNERKHRAKPIANAIDQLRRARVPQPMVTDHVEKWLTPRAVKCLQAVDIHTLAELTVRVPRRRRWWTQIPGLGPATARTIQAFFDEYSELTERARALIPSRETGGIAPWEYLELPEQLDGSAGKNRASPNTCILRASNDYEAVQAWLELNEGHSTQRAYRKEAERLMLWAILERGCALSSLATEDAIAYRAFLRRPTPRARWVGPSRPRHSPEWRPFAGDLSARSVSYALSVLGALFRWLIEQRYVAGNPFAGVKARSRGPQGPLDASRGFTSGEWALLRAVAGGLEWSYGWTPPAAQRLRFILDFSYGTGLRVGEFVCCTLVDVIRDGTGAAWLKVLGKGGKAGKVSLPSLPYGALEQYLAQRGLSTLPSRWSPKTHLLAPLEEDAGSITTSRLWAITRRFFDMAANVVEAEAPALAYKLRKASPHWMRHTHATHALDAGAELTTVRDNLRHASISTTSVYLHSDDAKRAQQLAKAFTRP